MRNTELTETAEQSDSDPTMLLSKADLAGHFRCSERQIDKLTADGKIPQPIILGNTRRWQRSVIVSWLDGLSSQA